MGMRYRKILTFLLVVLFASDVLAKKKVSSVFNDPFLMRGPGRTKTGFLPDLLDSVLGQGRYKFVHPTDGSYGRFINGTWNGMVGSVISGEADMVAADLTMTSKRAEVLHFTVPYMTAHLTVLLKKERRRGGRHGEESGRHKYKNVLEMLDNPNFNFMVVRGGATFNFFKQSNIAYHRQIFQRIQGNTSRSVVSSYNDAVQKMEEADGHDVGMLIESPSANWRKAKDCKLYSVGNLGERYYGLAVKRSGTSAAVVKGLSKKILELQETGRLTLLVDTYFGNSKCYKKEKKLRQQQQSSQSLPPWFRSNQGGGIGMTPTGYGISVDKAYFGGEGTCNSMKLDVADIKATVHDIKREVNNMKSRLNV